MKSIQQVTGGDGSNRAVSEVLAIVLLVGIVFLIIGAILLVGGSQIAQDREANEIAQVEQALTELDSGAARVGSGSSNSRHVDLGVRINQGTLEVDENSGHISVSIGDFDGDPEGEYEPLMDEPLGAVRYESGETTVAYQGGGVWRSDGDGNSNMVSPPEISAQDDTLTMPIINPTHGESVHSEATIGLAMTTDHFPNEDWTNKLEDSELVITIESEYYRAWGKFFESEIENADVTYYDDQNLVRVYLLGGVDEHTGVGSGIIATSATGELNLGGQGGNPAYVGSYDSSEKSFEDHDDDEKKEGDIKSAGPIYLSGNAEIWGDAHSGERICGGGQGNNDCTKGAGDSNITGDAFIPEEAEGQLEESSIDVQGDIVADEGYGIPSPAPNDFEINEGYYTPDIDGDTELDDGEYYIDELILNEGQELTLDTEEGDITIHVNDYMALSEDSTIEVVGDGSVNLYMGTEDGVDPSEYVGGHGSIDIDEAHFIAASGASIEVPEDKSTNFRIWGKKDFNAVIGESGGDETNVTAAILAPTGVNDGDGSVEVYDANVLGTIITGSLTADPGDAASIYFDRALMDEDIFPEGFGNAIVDYLYITEKQIEVGG